MSEKLIKEIKQKKPTLQELKIILKKNKIISRDEIHELFIKHDLLKYIKKDTQFITMKKKADKNVDKAYKELSGNPFKNAMKSLKEKLKLQFSKKKSIKRVKKTRKNKKTKKYKNLFGGNNIEFKFIHLNDYTDEEKEHKLKEIDGLLENTNTQTNDSSFFKKNVLRFMEKSHVLYMLYNEQIIGIITGHITDENYINISEVAIRAKYLNKEYKDIGISGRKLLTEYINKITSKYENISGFELFNAGGVNSCFLYTKVFKELGYKIEPDNINCNLRDSNYTVMRFSKI